MLINIDYLVKYLMEKAEYDPCSSECRVNKRSMKLLVCHMVTSALLGNLKIKDLTYDHFVVFTPWTVFTEKFEEKIKIIAEIVSMYVWNLHTKNKKNKPVDISEARKLMNAFRKTYTENNLALAYEFMDIFDEDSDKCHDREFTEFIIDQMQEATREQAQKIIDVLSVQNSPATRKKTEKMLDLVEEGTDPIEALTKVFSKKNVDPYATKFTI